MELNNEMQKKGNLEELKLTLKKRTRMRQVQKVMLEHEAQQASYKVEETLGKVDEKKAAINIQNSPQHELVKM